MQQKAYSVRDSKSESFRLPFFQRTHGEAERFFDMLANDKQSIVQQYPEDHDLDYLGDFDTNTGTFAALDTPQHIIKAINLPSRNQRS